MPLRSGAVRRRVGALVSFVLVASGLAIVGVSVAPAPPASAADPFDCGTIYAQQGSVAPRNIWSVNTSNGNLTSAGSFATVPSTNTGNINGLGINDDGTVAYAILPEANNARGVYQYVRSSETSSRLGDGTASSPVTHGAVNPVTNIYYYGGITAGANNTGTLSVYGFNPSLPAAQRNLGLVAQGTIPAGGGNGDFAFDQLGRLYVTGGGSSTTAQNANILAVINQTIPASAQSTPLAITGTQLSSIPTPASQAVNGVALGGNGRIYLSSQQQLFEADPNSGSVVNTYNLSTQGQSVDLASCARPSTVTVRKSFPQGRVNAADQATISVSGANVTTTSATTTGSATGLQAAQAGPVFGTSGTTYTISESGPGTVDAGPTQAGYTKTWSCVNAANNNAPVASGTGTTGTFTMPASGATGQAVVCTFTNTAQVARLELDKTAGTPTGSTAGSTITYGFAVTNTGTVPLTAVSVSDPKVGTVACGSGSLAVGATRTCSPVTYTLTQADVNAGRVDNTATATGTATNLPNATGTDSTSTTITRTPSLQLTKTAGTVADANGNGLVDAGDTLPYSFAVTNNGNVTITGLAINDAKVGATTCQATTLAPGAATTCSTNARYTITAADQTAGAVTNTATATGTSPAGATVTSNQSSTRTPITAPNPALTLTKTAGTPVDVNSSGITDAGDTIAYTFAVTNSGNVAISGLAINDPKVGATTCTATSLAVGASTTCRTTAPYVVTQADQTAGTVANSATATGTAAGGGTVTSNQSTTRTAVTTPNPQLTLAKTAAAPVDVNSSGITDAGDTIRYTFTVTNGGNVPIRNVAVSDPLLAGLTPPITVACGATTLQPGASTTCTTSRAYTVTTADEVAGRVANTANATGTNPDNGAVRSGSASTSTPVTQPRPSLGVVKQVGQIVDADGSGLTDAGDTISYSFRVTNTGNVPIRNVGIADAKLAGITINCPLTTLQPGAATTCTTATPYTVTADDERSGAVTNSARATGTNPNGGAVSSDPSTAQVPTTAQSAVLTLTKGAGDPVDVNASGITDAGDTIRYTFTVRNDGNVGITGLVISDPRAPPAGITCNATTLAVGAQTTCAFTYTVTADDEQAGRIVNVATASGQTGRGTVTSNASSATVAPVTAPVRSLSVVKQAGVPVDTNNSGLTDAGDTIAYTFAVTNTGNVPLSAVGITDAKVTGIDCGTTRLLPNATRTCTAAPYVITAADVAAGSATNTATANGTAPGVGNGPGVAVTSAPSSTSTPTTAPVRSLSLTKTAGTPVDVNGSGITDAGDTIAYSFLLTNTGNVPLSAASVADAKLAGATPPIGITCGVTAIAPGSSIRCTADRPYAVTAADQAAGSVANTATATANAPGNGAGGAPVAVTSNASSTTTPVTAPAPSLSLVKTAGTPVDVNGNGLTDAGDRIVYTFSVTNTGNVPITGVAVSDPKIGSVLCGDARIEPGGTASCRGASAYVVTPADVSAGSVANTATASGTNPDGGTVTSNASSTSTPTTAAAPALTMTKTAGTPVDVNGSGITDAGDTIAYTFSATNTGNVPLELLRIDDPTAGSVTCQVRTLAPGASTTCETDTPVVVTDRDEAAGSYTNSAAAVANVPGGGTVRSDTDSTTTTVTAPAPSLSVDKRVVDVDDVNGSGNNDAGDVISYAFTVTNDGNVPISGVAVEDTRLGGPVACATSTLAPGATTECTPTAGYTVTADDVAAGQVVNVADAFGLDPDGDGVRSPEDSTTTVLTAPAPALSIEKTADDPVDVNGSGIVDTGDTVQYRFTVTNTGNVPLEGVTVVDPLAGPVTCDVDTLGPGESTDCEADDVHVITAAEETAQVVRNTATAEAVDPDGGDVASDPDTVNVPVTQGAAVLTLDKTAAAPVDANGNGITDAGDTIAYSFTVTNDGNVPVSDVAVVDPMLAGSTPPITVTCQGGGPLLVGASRDCTADAPYVITADDAAAGQVVNTATATGLDPNGDDVESNEAVATTTPVTAAAPALSIDKRVVTVTDVNGSGITDAGDTIAYTFRVQNTGNVPVADVEVADAKVGAVSCPQATLAPGAAETCTATYTATVADETSGSVDNSATATGTAAGPGAGAPRVDVASDPDTTSTPTEAPAPALVLDKQAGPITDVNGSGLVDAGDTIDYSFVINNTGNVPIFVLEVVDPLVGTVACENVTIPAGSSFSCRALAPHTITDAEEAAGTVSNTAFARGENPDGGIVTSDPDTTETTVVTPDPEVTLTKAADDPVDVNGSGIVDAGDTIQYRFTVENTGDVPVTRVRVIDPLAGAVTCDPTSLAPGESTECTANAVHVITPEEQEAGEVVNTAIARVDDPDRQVVESAPDSTETAVATPTRGLELEKTAAAPVDVNGSGLTDAGDTIAYSFTVTNTGNVPVADLAIADDRLAGATPPVTITCTATSLAAAGAAGDSTTCTADAPYVVTDDDERAGEVLNTAAANATAPGVGDGPRVGVTSNDDSTSTPTAVPAPALTVVKSAAQTDVNESGLLDAGDTVAYSFTVTNSGNVPLTDVAIADDLLSGLTPPITVTCEDTELAVDADTTCTADAAYVVTAADVAAGVLSNTATATALDPDDGDVESGSSSVNLPTTAQSAVLTLEKTAATPLDTNGSGITDAGDTVAYSFTVTNDGNVPVRQIALSDPLLEQQTPPVTLDCGTGPLAPGDTRDCTASGPYVITGADEVAGQVLNSATASGLDPDDGDVDSNEATTVTPVTLQQPQLGLEKTAGTPVDVNGSGLVDAGDTIAYTFTVTNLGNVPVDDVAVGDPLAGAVTCDVTRLLPGEETDCAADAPYVITAADQTVGQVVNVATATGADPDGDEVGSPEASTTTQVDTPSSSLLLEKSAGTPSDLNGSGLTDAGDTIAYSFTVTNTGTVPVADLAIVDDLLGTQTPPIAVTCPVTVLSPDESTTCTADAAYEITDGDEAAGAVDNTATATATAPGVGNGPRVDVTSNADDTSTPVATPAPVLTLIKTADTPVDVNGSGITDAGDTIVYRFVVDNDGNVPLTGITVTDPLVGAVTCEPDALAPGGETTCVAAAPYVITEADEEAGSVVNTATASAFDPDDDVVESDEATTTTPVTAPVTSLLIEKTAATPVDVNDSGLVDAGDEIAYTFTVTNTGNVPVTGLVVNDPLAGGVTCDETTLAPGELTDCAADAPYVVTTVDETAGSVDNTASASALDPDDGDVGSNTDGTSTAVATPAPELTIDKRASEPEDVNGSGLVDAGDRITYSFTVTNDGDVPLSGITVSDPLFAGLNPPIAVDCTTTALAPGASTECTTDRPYVIRTLDEDAGERVNVATASGLDPDGETVTSEPDEVSTPVDLPQPSLSIDKDADVADTNGSGLTDAGDQVTYRFVVTNDGNVPITLTRVVDPLLAGQSPLIPITCDVTDLAPTEQASCEAGRAYVINAQDVERGNRANTALATGADPNGRGVTSDPDSVTIPTTPQARALTLEKTAATPVDTNGSGLVDAGDTIAYTFTVTNTGNVPVSSVGVDDPLVGAVTCDDDVIAANGGTTDCAADAPYVITVADETAGEVVNTATAGGLGPDGDEVTSPEDSTTTTVQQPVRSMTVDKQAAAPVDVNGNGITDPGDTVAYTFTVTNTGTVALSDVGVEDDVLDAAGIGVTCTPATLAANGGTTTCAADTPYEITAADAAAGSVTNIATAVGLAPGVGTDGPGVPVTSPSDTTTTPVTTAAPSLSIVKSADVAGPVAEGDEIVYSFTVTNAGNVALADVGVDDDLLAAVGIGVTCEETSLAVDAETTCTADDPYVVTAADLAAGSVDNVASATGVDAVSGDDAVSDSDEVSVPTDPAEPGLSIVKSAGTPVDVNGNGVTDAGDTVAYTFTVTNTGNVTVTDVAVDDPMLTDAGIAVTCDPTTLAPDGVADCQAEAAYEITTADETAGAVVNSAGVTADGPAGPVTPVTSAPVTTPVEAAEPELAIVKSADTADPLRVGDEVVYSFEVTNTGNVAVSDLVVDDPLLAGLDPAVGITCEATDLAAAGEIGDSTTCTADAAYVVTSEDVGRGELVNTATASAAVVGTGGGDVTSAPDTLELPTVVAAPSLALTKTAGAPVDVNGNGITDAGDTIAYTFTVTNNGNVALSGLTIADDLLDEAGIGVTCDETSLAIGASTDCEADAPYVITTADETAGEVENAATADAAGPGGVPVSDTDTVITEDVERAAPELTLVKSASTDGPVAEGAPITYSFVVTNSGNVPLTGVAVEDDLLADAGIAVSCAATDLAVGAVTTCTAEEPYVVTDADLAAGSVDNVATATGTTDDADDADVTSSPDDVSVPTVQADPSLVLTKRAAEPVDVNDNGLVDAGDTIAYTFVVLNNGDATLRGLTITDGLLRDAGIGVTCDAEVLGVGAFTECAADAPYTITADDVANGTVDNTATADATGPGGVAVTDRDSTSTELSAPSLGIEKRADTPGPVRQGDRITYSFTVENTGNVPLSAVRVVDPMLAEAGIGITCARPTLEVGGTVDCIADAAWVVNPANMRDGEIVNVANAVGDAAEDTPVTSPEDDVTTPTVGAAPAISLDKQAGDPVDRNGNGRVDAGDTIAYTFTVSNTGNVTLTDVEVTDAKLAPITVQCPRTTLDPGEGMTCAASAPYVITPGDVASGSVDNVASVVGRGPGGTVVDSGDRATSPTGRIPVDGPGGGPGQPGGPGDDDGSPGGGPGGDVDGQPSDGPLDGLLPDTGGPALLVGLLGLLLLGTGLGTVAWTRRRRR